MSACYRWILTALVVALMTVASVYACDENRPEKLARLKTELNLSDAQVDRFDQQFDILDAMAERASSIKAEIAELETSLNRDPKTVSARRAELEHLKRAFSERTFQAYRSVLTKEQFARWQVQQNEHEKRVHSAKK